MRTWKHLKKPLANPKPRLSDQNAFTEYMNIVMKLRTKNTIWRICHVELVKQSISVANNVVNHLAPVSIVLVNNLGWMESRGKPQIQ